MTLDEVEKLVEKAEHAKKLLSAKTTLNNAIAEIESAFLKRPTSGHYHGKSLLQAIGTLSDVNIRNAVAKDLKSLYEVILRDIENEIEGMKYTEGAENG